MAQTRSLTVIVLLSACLLDAVLHTRAQSGPVGQKCPPLGGETGNPSCVCQHPKGVIDLRPLASNTSEPKFKDILQPDGDFKFDYNPCSTFSEQDPCTDVYICQSSSDNAHHYKIADAGTEQIYIDENEGIYVYYTSPGDGTDVRESMVKLECDKGVGTGKEVLTTTGDNQVKLTYRFTLTSCHACPGGCGGGGGSIAGYAGIIIILLVILAVVLYFIIGAVILKVHYQKTGSDIVPNKSFWLALPVLIKDGFKFTFSPCLKKIRKDSYESM